MSDTTKPVNIALHENKCFNVSIRIYPNCIHGKLIYWPVPRKLIRGTVQHRLKNCTIPIYNMLIEGDLSIQEKGDSVS